MLNRKPQVVVFFGGEPSSHVLSTATGYWACQYIPRSKYGVIPVHITPDGKWQVPLGSLPQQGQVNTMMKSLFSSLKGLSPKEGLSRLLKRPVAAMMSVLRGRGGDDGAIASLGQSLNIPVVGPTFATHQQTYNKRSCSMYVDDIASSPFTLFYPQNTPLNDIVTEIREQLVPPLFIKPVANENSHGVQHVQSLDELTASVKNALAIGDIIVQEQSRGTEVNLSLFADDRGKVQSLPPTVITPKSATFFDHQAKHQPGRVDLHTLVDDHNSLHAEAEAIARDVYDRLNCRGYASFDFIADQDNIDLLEVNTIPSYSDATPLKHQLKVGGLHPTTLLNNLILNTLERR